MNLREVFINELFPKDATVYAILLLFVLSKNDEKILTSFLKEYKNVTLETKLTKLDQYSNQNVRILNMILNL